MVNYGIPYMGNKSAIADDIINFLPAGKRFVDLFGGGFAISHCVLNHINDNQISLFGKKWESILYNDYNPLIVDLIKRALNGEFSYDKFKPQFITREDFFNLKDKDGYVKYIWSFGNTGRNYMFNPEIEQKKKLLHNAIIFNDFNKKVLDLLPSIEKIKNIKDITLKRKFVCSEIKKSLRCDMQQLERLQISNISYLDYKYKDGDVVYCDIPYENTTEYDNTFNHKEFYEWAISRKYPVYFSSYEINDDRFDCVWSKLRRSTLSPTNNNCYKVEKIYTNKKGGF